MQERGQLVFDSSASDMGPIPEQRKNTNLLIKTSMIRSLSIAACQL